MSRFLPLSDKEREEMLKEIGREDLFSPIPEELRLKDNLKIKAHSEKEVLDFFKKLADMNKNLTSFAGAGIYHHFIPSAVDYLSMREEFLTAYTPYQPEISQGTLQAIFEYQTMMSNILNMEVSNASMYDGATALAESILMAKRIVRKKNTVAISKGVHPHYLKVVKTYLKNLGINIIELELKDYATDIEGLKKLLSENDDIFAVAVGYPNFFGNVENLKDIVPIVKEYDKKAIVITSTTEPLAFGLIAPPGDFGVEIACGDAQSFGNYPGFGGPLLGFLTTTMKHVRQMPGRVVGKTKDVDGKTGYVLTLSAREQHIKRERATSNICSNQGWCMLRATIYLSLLGEEGFKKLASLNYSLSEYAKEKINKTKHFKVLNTKPTFNEFLVQTDVDFLKFRDMCEENGIFPGVRLAKFGLDKDKFILTCTEVITTEDIDKLIELMEKAQ
ncbi:glycine dehydrogenase subunit 1 [Thermotomaculum hydrothermale]|uniref:Glycine dehydrogenase subunit 1 n=1 Tax=Thermotomaculum hydrothermale TaxID=981385 RepID=A0A7R6PDZ5_9BACT|nr:aminomethyl-transferring glycine dehydrogenase subunit GcvPA [Thermotomaculum hydrothermale]BBB31923.1 glycine dehydrogenase subunit 1 [Thermotomaculum hydrothermale]